MISGKDVPKARNTYGTLMSKVNPSMESRSGPNVSLNFSVAKVIAIFTVVAGHWFTGTVLWIPVTFGLFIFAFSSAYFTSRAYGTEVKRRQFWRKKFERLGPRYWLIMSFLVLILLFKGKSLLHWHSLIHYLGLSGFLNWFDIPNQSALGAGLWFFTLLLLFYIGYPYLAELCKSKSVAFVTTIIASVATLFLEMNVKVGHELWLTLLGFILGVAFGLHDPHVSAKSATVLTGFLCTTLLVLNLFSDYKQLNSVLILGASVSISIMLTRIKLPESKEIGRIAEFEAYLLEIFLIHTYLFIRFTGISALDFFVSLILIVSIAITLNGIISRLSLRLFPPD